MTTGRDTKYVELVRVEPTSIRSPISKGCSMATKPSLSVWHRSSYSATLRKPYASLASRTRRPRVVALNDIGIHSPALDSVMLGCLRHRQESHVTGGSGHAGYQHRFFESVKQLPTDEFSNYQVVFLFNKTVTEVSLYTKCTNDLTPVEIKLKNKHDLTEVEQI